MRRNPDDVDRDAFSAVREERDRQREPGRTYPRRSLARRWAFQARVIDTINELAATTPHNAARPNGVVDHDSHEHRACVVAGQGADGAEESPVPIDAPDSDVMTVEESAAYLRIGRNALYDAIGRNDIPHRRIGKSIRLSRIALRRWLDAAAESPDRPRRVLRR